MRSKGNSSILILLLILIALGFGGVILGTVKTKRITPIPSENNPPTPVSDPSTTSEVGKIICGGFANLPCPTSGYTCTPEGNYPDAATVCVRKEQSKDSGSCVIGGCSSEVCSDRVDIVSPCIFKPEYACYKTAICELQSDGNCGWTQTEELRTCIKEASSNSLEIN